MGRLFNSLSPGPRNAAFSEPFWRDIGEGAATGTGVHVNYRTALHNPTALRCGLLVADGVSTVPCKLMKKEADGTRKEATDHPAYDLLRYMPCGWMTSQQFRETMMLRAVFLGEGFAFVNKVGRGRISELWPFEVGEVEVTSRGDPRDRSPLYMVNGEEVPQSRILHMRGPSWNGRGGLNMVHLAKEVLGLAVATEQAHASRFKNGVQNSGVYSVEGSLDAVQHKRLLAHIMQNSAGLPNSGKPLLLDRAAKWVEQGMSGVDAEHLATRQYQDMLTCRGLGVLPIMVGIADKTATYASSEQMFLAHCVHTVRPWHNRTSEIFDCFLLTAEERRAGYYFHFVDTALLRGSAQARAEFYAKLFNVGSLTPNQILGFEDMNGFKGGDSHYVQGAMGRINEDGTLEKMGSGDATGPQNDPPPPRFNSERVNVGRVLSGKNEELIRGAHDDLGTVLDQLAQEPEE
jgi:HK97 family phage portal protein